MNNGNIQGKRSNYWVSIDLANGTDKTIYHVLDKNGNGFNAEVIDIAEDGGLIIETANGELKKVYI